ncbi:hypothetical protein PAL_GLEAN10009704 [Pteropus alecto]|uniref:Uncharacterized protein n=1 Tax=Pteropus alecto TaxID=9402 RepID=L5KRF8_PTEAL|nr:hypothetical protein PAL_GLEAN10009704 [Pteropus alecto]
MDFAPPRQAKRPPSDDLPSAFQVGVDLDSGSDVVPTAPRSGSGRRGEMAIIPGIRPVGPSLIFFGFCASR